MEEKDARERVKTMIGFIKAEAEEKAKDIQNDTEQEYEISKSKHLAHEREKVQVQYDKKFRQLKIKKRIDKSSAINQSRLQKMQTRQTCMEEVLQESTFQLQQMTENKNKYKSLLQSLIVQGLIKLCETSVEIRCRKQDVQLIKELLDPAKNQFVQTMKQQTNKDYSVELSIDSNNFLDEDSQGGVILMTNNGLTRCINTLAERLKQVYQGNLPQVRKMLFS